MPEIGTFQELQSLILYVHGTYEVRLELPAYEFGIFF